MDFNEQNISILTGSACPPMPLLKSITIHVDSIFNSSTSKHDIIMISAIIKNVWIFFFVEHRRIFLSMRTQRMIRFLVVILYYFSTVPSSL